MSLDREARLDKLFHGALAVPSEQRDAFLARDCAPDREMLALVKALLRHHEAPGPVDLDRPALAHLAEQIRGDAPEDGPQSSSDCDPAATLPRRFGDYQLLRELGRGGMGVVYLAQQLSANRPVAVKILRARVLEDLPPDRREQAVQRFRAEAEAMARLAHEHIVTVYEVGACDGRHYYSMRYVEGRNLAELVRKHPLDGREAAPLVERAARAVHYAHSQGVLHRDLTPGNILIDHGNQPFVADFGLVKLLESDSELTRTGEFLGTPGYVAPEQADNPSRASAASDVYSLGATLYHLLTGRPPFQAATVAETLRQVRAEEPVAPRTVNPSVTRDLETICLKCLEKEPTRRYASCEQLADDLGRWQRGEPIRARPVRLPERCWRWCRRRPTLAGLTAALVFVVLVAMGLIVASEARAREGERHAEERLHQTEAAQREAEDSHATTLRLIHEVLLFVDRTPRQAPNQGLPMEMLREVEAQCEGLLRKRPADAKLLLLQSGVCVEQAIRHSAHKQNVQAEQAYRRAARVLQEAVQSRKTDHWDRLLGIELWIRLGIAHDGLGERAAALVNFRRAERLLQDAADSQEIDLNKCLRVIELSMPLGNANAAAGEHAAALANYRRAAKLIGLAKPPPHDLKLRCKLAQLCVYAGQVLRRHGAVAESPQQLELARQLFEGLVHEEPEELWHLVRLGDTWYQLGHTRRILEQHDDALTAYRQSVQAHRTAFERAPEVPEYRKSLSVQYGRLAYWLRLRGCLSEAAANLLEQKKLWPRNAEKLRDISEELTYVAHAVGRGRKELTPAEQEERQRYLDLSAQVARQASASR